MGREGIDGETMKKGRLQAKYIEYQFGPKFIRFKNIHQPRSKSKSLPTFYDIRFVFEKLFLKLIPIQKHFVTQHLFTVV